MSLSSTVRVAAAQFVGGIDLDANLAACLAAIDRAADGGARLVVLPEFANHLSWYSDAEHCWRVALDAEGLWLGAIADRAHTRELHVVVNVTMRRDHGRCTATSLLFGPDGTQLGESDKQVLIGHENDFLARAERPGAVVETQIGRLGLYACMDGVIAEPARTLVLRGAEILCNSLNSFALDEAALHVPVRGAENRVFVVAANKIGPLVPAELVEVVSATTAIPVEFLSGAGESQIIGPDGAVLARASRDRAEVVFADIVPAHARDKLRPDGTDVIRARRPQLYRALAAPPDSPAGRIQGGPPGRDRLSVAAVAIEATGASGLDEAIARLTELSAAGVSLVVLPELFAYSPALFAAPRSTLAAYTTRVLAALAMAGHSDTIVVTSVPAMVAGVLEHHGVALAGGRELLRQPQLHAVGRHAWARPPTMSAENPVRTHDAAWGRLALIVGDDLLYPEVARLAALAGAAVVAAPFELLEPWEGTLGLPERAAENRLNFVAATRWSPAGGSVVASLPDDFTIMTPWRSRGFDGLLSSPSIYRARPGAGVLRAVVAPAAAANKTVSHRTDLVAGRPWHLLGALVEEVAHVD